MVIAHFDFNGDKFSAEVASGLFAPTAKEMFGTVEEYCRLSYWMAGFLKYENVKTSLINCYYSDPNFFNFFDFPIIEGNKENPFQNPNDVVISESLANQLFGDDDPIEKIVVLDNGNPIRITAIMKNMPHNTFLQNVDLVSLFDIDPESYYNRIINTWNGCEFYTFLRLKEGTDIVQLAEQVTKKQTTGQDWRLFSLQPLINLRLYNIEGEPSVLKTVRLYQFIALTILVIACINYVNLLTARASKRHREIGLKKIIGAHKFGLFMQLMGEAVILFVISIFLSILLIFGLLDGYNAISGKEMTLSILDGKIWIIHFGMLIVVTVLAGIYPAYILASFKTGNIAQSVKPKIGNNLFRKILVVTQFASSTILIIITIAFVLQLKYIREKDLGYDREHILTCELINMRGRTETVKAELERHTFILGVTVSSHNILKVESTNSFEDWEGKTNDGVFLHNQLRIDTSFVRVMGLKLVEGENFTSEGRYLLNETAVKAMGLTDPIGKWVNDPSQKIVGVLKDFHFTSLHNPIEPFVMFYNQRDGVNILYVRIAAGKAKEAIEAVEKVWQTYNEEYPFEYSFLDDTFDSIYKSDVRTGRLFGIFSIIAILISCLGLFGLVVFSAEMKTKEIGIRKTLGGTVFDIVKLLINEFLILVGISILIAIPLAYIWLHNILQDYAYRIPLSWQIFAGAALITIVLTLLTVSFKAIRAATANPVEAIKVE